jgi:O-antigen ligase
MLLVFDKYKKYISVLIIGIIFGILSFILPFWTLAKAVGAAAVLVTIFWNVNAGAGMAVALAPFLNTTYNIAIAAICIMSFIARMLFKKDLHISKTPFSIATLVFAGIILYNVLISFRPEGSIPVIIVYIVFIMLYFVLTALIKDKQQLLTICTVLVFAGFAISLFGIYQYFWGIPTNYAWVDKKMFANVSVRVYSVFSNPNVLGQYLVLIVPITIGMFFIRKDKLEKVVYSGMSLVMLICLILTLSRGAWLGMMVALAIFVFLKDKRLIILGATLLLTLPFVLPSSVINRFTSIGNLKESSSAYRYSVWIGSIDIIKDFWIAGIGIGTKAFEFIYPGYAVVGATYALHSHNFYLQIIIETGILGFAVFLIMLLTFYKNMFSTARESDDNTLSTLAIALISGMSGYLFYGIFDNSWYDFRMVLMFWIITALGMSAYNIMHTRSGTVTE